MDFQNKNVVLQSWSIPFVFLSYLNLSHRHDNFQFNLIQQLTAGVDSTNAIINALNVDVKNAHFYP